MASSNSTTFGGPNLRSKSVRKWNLEHPDSPIEDGQVILEPLAKALGLCSSLGRWKILKNRPPHSMYRSFNAKWPKHKWSRAPFSSHFWWFSLYLGEATSSTASKAQGENAIFDPRRWTARRSGTPWSKTSAKARPWKCLLIRSLLPVRERSFKLLYSVLMLSSSFLKLSSNHPRI